MAMSLQPSTGLQARRIRITRTPVFTGSRALTMVTMRLFSIRIAADIIVARPPQYLDVQQTCHRKNCLWQAKHPRVLIRQVGVLLEARARLYQDISININLFPRLKVPRRRSPTTHSTSPGHNLSCRPLNIGHSLPTLPIQLRVTNHTIQRHTKLHSSPHVNQRCRDTVHMDLLTTRLLYHRLSLLNRPHTGNRIRRSMAINAHLPKLVTSNLLLVRHTQYQPRRGRRTTHHKLLSLTQRMAIITIPATTRHRLPLKRHIQIILHIPKHRLHLLTQLTMTRIPSTDPVNPRVIQFHHLHKQLPIAVGCKDILLSDRSRVPQWTNMEETTMIGG